MVAALDGPNTPKRDTRARALTKALLLAACEPFHPTGSVCQWVRDQPGYKADASQTNVSSPEELLGAPVSLAQHDDNAPRAPTLPRAPPPPMPPPLPMPPPTCHAPPPQPPRPRELKPRGAQVISDAMLTRAATEIHRHVHVHIAGVDSLAAISTSEDLQRALVREMVSPKHLSCFCITTSHRPYAHSQERVFPLPPPPRPLLQRQSCSSDEEDIDIPRCIASPTPATFARHGPTAGDRYLRLPGHTCAEPSNR